MFCLGNNITGTTFFTQFWQRQFLHYFDHPVGHFHPGRLGQRMTMFSREMGDIQQGFLLALFAHFRFKRKRQKKEIKEGFSEVMEKIEDQHFRHSDTKGDHPGVALSRVGTSQDVPSSFRGGYISEYFTV